MRSNRLLLCTDMDRTVIPNGHQQEHPDAREMFHQFCSSPGVKLAYVTGRHLTLVKQAITEYGLPQPEYVITDVGTKIYQWKQSEYYELLQWQEKIAKDWQGSSHAQLRQALERFPELVPQEQDKQNDFKLSFYLRLNKNHDSTLKEVEQQLDLLGVAASLILSVDEPKQVALLDVLPSQATKLHAIEFLQKYLGYRHKEIIFAGDSGNDLMVLGSSIQSILVANAEPKVKQQALKLAKKNGTTEFLYQAQQERSSLGGNYSAGILQGITFFAPDLSEKLKLS